MPKPYVLNRKNYFSSSRPHVSNSMISDYIKSPAFYKLKYIDKKLSRVTTPSMRRGSMVDDILTNAQNKKKKIVSKFSSEQKKTSEYYVTRSVEEQALEIARAVNDQPLWHLTKEPSFQEIVEGSWNNIKLCGMLDRADILFSGKHVITDLKVVAPQKLSTAQKWLRNAEEFGYLRQFAIYRDLYAKKHGIDYKDIICRHFVAALEQPGLVRMKVFTISPALIDAAWEEVVIALQGIEAGDFSPPPIEECEITF